VRRFGRVVLAARLRLWHAFITVSPTLASVAADVLLQASQPVVQSSISTMKVVRCRQAVDVVVATFLLLDAGWTSPSSSLNYCHRLDEHPSRLYATKTAYDEVRSRDLETRKLVVGTDDSSPSSTSGVSSSSQLGMTDDYFGQR